MSKSEIPGPEQFLKNTMRTTVHVHPDLYKALRIRLIAQGKTVVEWVREQMYAEVFADVLAQQDNQNAPANTADEIIG